MYLVMADGLAYENTFELPTKGMLYKNIPGTVSMRGMTTREEKIIFASNGGNVFDKVLQRCVTEPANLDTDEFIFADELYLMLQLRKITYGEEYKVVGVCPHCGAKSTYKINLNDLEVKYLADDFVEPIEVKLPIKGDTLGLKFLRNSDIKYIDKTARKLSKQFDIPVKEMEMDVRLARHIVTINGKDVSTEEARSYIDAGNGLSGKDSAYIWSALNKYDFGCDTLVSVDCDSCDKEFEFNLPISSEFFRPSYD